ncbi:MAG: glycosyltransferase family 2 protein [Lachnospiraceae bacterium]|nr:glycosyltransferase family 2 protein [Lachnospiraceae bacterium]
MIVKNEEQVLARCLDSIVDLMDEVIIVDTGSTDATKEIAAKYTDKVYDFAWTGSFSDARNYSFSLATKDYIYCPDADEVLDEENRGHFRKLKEALLPEIEIVQMKYRTVTEFNTVLNIANEYRPKLFKRLREFTWVDPIHETVRIEPVVYDSDIEILHKPTSMHSKRDFGVFERLVRNSGELSPKLLKMYIRELYMTGDKVDLSNAEDYLVNISDTTMDVDVKKSVDGVLLKNYRLNKREYDFMKTFAKAIVNAPCSETCMEAGLFYMSKEDYGEAALWLFNAVNETESLIDIHTSGDVALENLINCYMKLGEGYEDLMAMAKQKLKDWKLPEESAII